eukprot:6210932-Pleurochrysis_carterae.AAC.2
MPDATVVGIRAASSTCAQLHARVQQPGNVVEIRAGRQCARPRAAQIGAAVQIVQKYVWNAGCKSPPAGISDVRAPMNGARTIAASHSCRVAPTEGRLQAPARRARGLRKK